MSSIVDNSQCKQIQDYLNNPTSSLSVNLQKQGSDFRNKVWAEICKIPVGKVLSYSELASKAGSGARAVANACRDNPFPGIIPCHRVVSVSGLGGYMGQTSGKLFSIKEKLLAIECE
ncbi:MAG: MGMT family protein [Methylococcales bacterium]|nr:MGMT family protein [Methylococcales bacterium]